jgi:hypothetical protein
MDAFASAALAGLAGLAFLLVRRLGAISREVADLSERVRELSARLHGAEQDAAAAVGRAEVAEAVLLEKGLADEEDLEAARRRFGEGAQDAAGGGDVH